MSDDYRRDLKTYLVGLMAAAILTATAFGLVAWGGLPRGQTLVAIGALAAIQVAVQVRYFLHVDLSRQKREDLHLILFSSLILLMMAGGTIWLLADLSDRMMVIPQAMAK